MCGNFFRIKTDHYTWYHEILTLEECDHSLCSYAVLFKILSLGLVVCCTQPGKIEALQDDHLFASQMPFFNLADTLHWWAVVGWFCVKK